MSPLAYIQVHYSKNMPDIETLMQEWPSELEDTLKHLQLPDGASRAPISAVLVSFRFEVALKGEPSRSHGGRRLPKLT